MADLKRVDPPSRKADGDTNSKIVNKNPDRWYVLANPNDEHCGVSAMLELDFVVEEQRKGGPRIVGAQTSAEGSAIMYRGQILMSCPMESYLQRYNQGQSRADAIDEQIRKPGGIDGLRGTTGRLTHNETTKEIVNLS